MFRRSANKISLGERGAIRQLADACTARARSSARANVNRIGCTHSTQPPISTGSVGEAYLPRRTCMGVMPRYFVIVVVK